MFEYNCPKCNEEMTFLYEDEELDCFVYECTHCKQKYIVYIEYLQ